MVEEPIWFLCIGEVEENKGVFGFHANLPRETHEVRVAVYNYRRSIGCYTFNDLVLQL